MKRILLVDYYGICNKEGKPIGHSQKVLREYNQLIKDDFLVSAAVSPCLVFGLDEEFAEVISLKHNVGTEKKTLLGRIVDKFKLMANIKQVLKLKGYDIIWFYRTDFFFFLYFFLKSGKEDYRIIGQVYQEEFSSGKIGQLLTYIYMKGALKLDGLIYTQKGMAQFHQNILYIPDYYYDEKKYGKYKKSLKREMAVCLGTMNPYKKLEELVDAFNENGIHLEIKGYFYEKKRFAELVKRKRDNIIIEDVILDEEEYYRLLSEARYSILPYDMKQYSCRTSGILQESLFLNTIPVAPKLLLEDNDIEGIGYEEIGELKNTNWLEKECFGNDQMIQNVYNKENIKSKLISFFS